MTPPPPAPADEMMDSLLSDVSHRLLSAPDQRLQEVMKALVRHLHSFAREVRLTEAEWTAGIAFLTATGQKSDGIRQEFILLSDTLGVSSLVDLLNHASDDPRATAPTILGPFYVPDSPWRENGSSMSLKSSASSPDDPITTETPRSIAVSVLPRTASWDV